MDIIVEVFLPLGLVFIMFSLGLGLTVADFTRVLRRPIAFLIGAFHQVLLLPLITFAVIKVFGINGELAVGFMILAACPGGVTSNVISRLAKADVALSVSLTAVISLVSISTVPLIVSFAYDHFMSDPVSAINIIGTAITMFALTAVPILLALAARKLFPGAISRSTATISKIAVALFAIIVAAALASNWSLFIDNIQVTGGALITLLTSMLVLGYLIPRLLGRSALEAKTVCIETGIQNATLGIAIATLIVGTDAGFTAFSIPAAVYGIVMYLTLVPVLLWFRHQNAAKADA